MCDMIRRVIFTPAGKQTQNTHLDDYYTDSLLSLILTEIHFVFQLAGFANIKQNLNIISF